MKKEDVLARINQGPMEYAGFGKIKFYTEPSRSFPGEFFLHGMVMSESPFSDDAGFGGCFLSNVTEEECEKLDDLFASIRQKMQRADTLGKSEPVELKEVRYGITGGPFYRANDKILSLEDYVANPRDYRIVLFLNAFHLTGDERAALVESTRRPGMTAIWIGPAGGVTDGGFDDEAMSALTGVAATGVARRPRVVCRDPDAKRVCSGKAWAKTLAGGARSIVVPEMPAGGGGIGIEEYASLLREAGAWRYTAPGNYFRRHGDVFMFHTGTPGSHVIRLPGKADKVRELFTGQEFDSNELTLETDGPNTWLFKATASEPR